ncbi:probable ATP-dependent RNA helicase DDX27 [Physella acuta]|uniref:probable ATP-dependent RNA helicase DDX27 n=1 Tax=Physella acuta TaxID=109671 RepID=UPI0027DCB575|nr:probable ATP-dependent RNA helicase DDX27 [Physella acuta]
MSIFLKDLGLIKTIEDTDNVPDSGDSSDDGDGMVSKKQKKKMKKTQNLFNSSFSFVDGDTLPVSKTTSIWNLKPKGMSNISSLDDKIKKVRREKLKQNGKSPEEEDEMSMEEDIDSSDEEDIKMDTIKTKDKKRKRSKKGEVEEEELAKVQFSESIDTYDEKLSFQEMNLSRPLLKGLSALNFLKPTPIQAACIPVALLGRDICACAVTGSGKTIAFMLPILERLMYRPKATATTRVLILVPTRELAVQVHTVARQLAQHANIDICLAAGGLDLKAQEAMLRLGPDIVIATPGRLIDHLHNSMNFTLNNIEILVLDEADRMLDEYFAEQMNEIIRLCARQRQTMLFSATMTETVQELVSVSLKDPVKVFVNQSTDVALGLHQEFVRIRPNREGDREAIVAALVSRNFCDRCIVFIQTKVQAHRMHILLGLLGINVGELHGNLSQAQRLDTLKKFKEGLIDVLLATDLASRGLDIEGVKTVINFTMPSTLKHYIHRVGRTARAGKSGRSVTLVGEKERKVLKEVVKEAKTPLKTRIIPQDVITKYRDKIASIEEDIKTIQLQQKEESHLRSVENKMQKAHNMLDKKEDQERPRSWFQSYKERKVEKAKLRLSEKDTKAEKKKTRKKLTAEDRVNFELTKAQLLSIRATKKSMKAKPLGAFSEESPKDSRKPKNKRKKPRTSGFEEELADIGSSAVKKFRAGPSYKERKEAMGPSKKGPKSFGRKKK